MDRFKESLFKNKTVSLWGIGYLGYTKLLRLQSKGFKANVYDLTGVDFWSKIKKGKYPDAEQVYSWSENCDVPKLDISKLNHCPVSKMFEAKVHILSFPVIDRLGGNLLRKVADIFLKNKNKLKDSLIIFQSVASPGCIDKNFVKVLKDNKVSCSFASAFRSDWTIEEFLSNDRRIVLAANDKASLDKAKALCDILGMRYKILSSIKEAEIYENAKNSFQYLTTSFINQLVFAYPDTNVKEMIGYLLNDVRLDESHLGIGVGGYKLPASVQNLLEGSRNPNFLSLVKEAQDINLGMILEYAELLKKRGCRAVTVMGLSIKGNQKNIEMSPSMILAEYLNKLNIAVYVDDPFFDGKALAKILPFAKRIDILKDGIQGDSLLVMTAHNKYKYINQKDMDKLGINRVSLILDNVSLFRNFSFPDSVTYHIIGDGKLSSI